jgi:tyrosyl-tRNA synthetase
MQQMKMQIFIKFYTFLPKEEIENLIEEHKTAPHERKLQKKLAEEVTVWVHERRIRKSFESF